MKTLIALAFVTSAKTFFALACATSFAFAQVTPSGGSVDRPILPGGNVKIGWTSYFDAPTVDIFLWNAHTSERTVVARNVLALQGTYPWVVPANTVSGSRYRFVVEPTMERYRRQMSAGWVTIGPMGMHKTPNEFELSDASYAAEPAVATVLTSSMSVAPQPARETARIRFESDFQTLRIVSLQGSTVLSRRLIGGERIVDVDVQNLAAGTYNVVLTSDDGRSNSSTLQVIP